MGVSFYEMHFRVQRFCRCNHGRGQIDSHAIAGSDRREEISAGTTCLKHAHARRYQKSINFRESFLIERTQRLPSAGLSTELVPIASPVLVVVSLFLRLGNSKR